MLAKARTDPNTGPIQGVQPKLKPRPRRKAENNSFFCLLAPKPLFFASQGNESERLPSDEDQG